MHPRLAGHGPTLFAGLSKLATDWKWECEHHGPRPSSNCQRWSMPTRSRARLC